MSRDIIERLRGPSPSIPAMRDAADEIERLRRAATTAAELIDKHLNTQREKVTDAAAILRDALQPR